MPVILPHQKLAGYLFGFLMHAKSHVAERLPAHLEHDQHVVFREGKEEETVDTKQTQLTKLDAWLQLNTDEYADAQHRSWRHPLRADKR